MLRPVLLQTRRGLKVGKLRELLDGTGGEPNFYVVPDRSGESRLQKRYEEECGPVVTKPWVEWITPKFRPVSGDALPTVHVGKTSVSFNQPALELLGFPERVQVGVTVERELAVRPVAPGEWGYKLIIGTAKNGAKSACAGRDYLVKQLIARGLSQGHYRLEYNAKLGCFVGRKVG